MRVAGDSPPLSGTRHCTDGLKLDSNSPIEKVLEKAVKERKAEEVKPAKKNQKQRNKRKLTQ